MRNKTGTHVFWENGVHYPRVSPGYLPDDQKARGLWVRIDLQKARFIRRFPRNRTCHRFPVKGDNQNVIEKGGKVGWGGGGGARARFHNTTQTKSKIWLFERL